MDEKCRQNTGTNPLCTRLHGDPAIGTLGPVYMDEKCRQNTGTNPLCTRLHGDPAKSRVEMQGHFSYPLSTRNFGGKRRVFSNSPMMHCARDSFIQDGCCFGLLALDNRINGTRHNNRNADESRDYTGIFFFDPFT
ncbi:hypothetical protein TNCV_4387161 [Trichonephila clavipes]|nr:hypothetical protein TNCV_4387161 [Trichonephila clavipes]